MQCAPSVAARPARAGFTLVELLVVIAIIALLLAILLPSLEQARTQAKKGVCASNLKGIATSATVYQADDPHDFGIPIHPLQYTQDSNEPTFIGAYEWGGKSGIGRKDFIAGQRGNLGSKYGTKAGFGPATRPLNTILYKEGFADFTQPTFNANGATTDTLLSLDLYRCPADEGPPRGAHCQDWIDNFPETSSYDYFGNSYAANLFMIGNTGIIMHSNSPYLRPITRVPTPARTIYFEENIGRWAWAAKNDQCFFLTGVDPGPTKVLDGWHKQAWSYNRAFVDAHAEYQKVYVEGTEDSEGYAEHYRNEELSEYPKWDSDGDGSPDTDGSFYLYQCVIVRGNGWQKDTLPSPTIFTGLLHSLPDRPSYEDCVTGAEGG